ncbi:unnamed protein product [Symbiodinium natans]|uniref:Uncharacterized protein n=1 Tax=Symbiodinium natans TaxID=878477 RepID=A0A812IHS8_9DINO|nr:unnamed protein product [Symbiodinium natans]
MEADVREALETSVEFLQSAKVVELKVEAPRTALQLSPRKMRLLPIGRSSLSLAALVEERLGDLWALTSSVKDSGVSVGGQTLVLLDLSDPDAVAFLRRRQEPQALHVLALLPSLAASRDAWQPIAEPLALLAGIGEEVLELGLVAVLTLGTDDAGLDVADALSFLEALASADLAAAAFQLQPRPQAHLALPAFEADATPILCAESAALGEAEVLASFTLWPCTGGRRLLTETVMQHDLPPSMSRAGVAYMPSERSTSRPRVWHLTVHATAEARLCRRAAGDFGGRARGAFAWRGGPGPKADLWAHAAALLGQHDSSQREEESEESCYSEEYEQEEDQESEGSMESEQDDVSAASALSGSQKKRRFLE